MATMLLCCSLSTRGVQGTLSFNSLEVKDGLSNGQVNDVLRDNNGFIWIATESGLDRYDGFRFRNFFYDNNDHTSLINNSIESVQQDFTGDLWVRTAMGYNIFNYQMEKFDRNPSNWLQTIGIKGTPDRIFIDNNKDMWFFVYGKGLYFLDHTSLKPFLFRLSDRGGNTIPVGSVCEMTNYPDGKLGVIYRDGTILKLDGRHRRVLTVDRHVYTLTGGRESTFSIDIDHAGNVFIGGAMVSFVYSASLGRWFDTLPEFLRSVGLPCTDDQIIIKSVAEDNSHNLWIATDHKGLYVVNIGQHLITNYTYVPNMEGSVCENTLCSVYADKFGHVWIGGYKNGLSFYSSQSSKFTTIPLGDICTISEDKSGLLWCGSNDNGIICYNRQSGVSVHYGKAQTGLLTDVVVSSLAARDGSLYFGTFNGGMARYKDGKWTAWHASREPGALSCNSVWQMAENKQGNIIIATLGGGVQIFNPTTQRFTTFNQANSSLPNDFINSVAVTPDGDYIFGHSQNFSVMDGRTYRISNYTLTRSGQTFISPSVNQIIMDSRRLIWMATPSGMEMYDPHNDQTIVFNDLNGMPVSVGCSVIEDGNGAVWLISDFYITKVTLKKDGDGKWTPLLVTFNSLDGLQRHQYNLRAVCRTHDGQIVVGGQDGINIIPSHVTHSKQHTRAVFSGLSVFGMDIGVGQEFNGRVILDEALNRARVLELHHGENAFSIHLATDNVTVPSRYRFVYRVNGFSDKWIMTPQDNPVVQFTNLESGHYTLQVKVIAPDGTLNDEISELSIIIEPPFYFSVWSQLFYILLIIAAVLLYRRHLIKKQRAQVRLNAEKRIAAQKKETDELRMNFFTNISHELRTPLTLIIGPVTQMVKKESDPSRRHKLELIERNANKLLMLVNQVLDFRKMDKGQEKLNAVMGDYIDVVRKVCQDFKFLYGKNISLEFRSSVKSLDMLFDADKVNKIFNNLLSNAFKFTPENGKVTVTVSVLVRDAAKGRNEDIVSVAVADTGCGISDEEKKKVFDQFYQVSGTSMQPYGGSGIGLSLVKNFVTLHDGTVTITDNPGGGAVFTVDIPIRFDVSRIEGVMPQTKDEQTDEDDAQTVQTEDSGEQQNTQHTTASDAVEEVEEDNENKAVQSGEVGDTAGHDKKDAGEQAPSAGEVPSDTETADDKSSDNGTGNTPVDAGKTAAGSDGSHDEKENGGKPSAQHEAEKNDDDAAHGKGGHRSEPLKFARKLDAERRQRHPLVLLVDDSADFCEFMDGELASDFKIINATNGRDGLSKAIKYHPDIILSDVMMPVMDGNEFCRKVKANEETTDIPFVMLTARLAQEQRIEGLESGADDYLTKPFNLDVLKLRMRNLIKWHERGNEREEAARQQATAEAAAEAQGKEQKAPSLSPMQRKLLARIDSYIADNYSKEDLNVETLAADIGTSRVQLYRHMVSLTGFTPSEYIRNFRLKKAETMLHDNDYSVQQIAEKVGFSNARSFAKFFSDMYGSTPLQYRKKQMGK